MFEKLVPYIKEYLIEHHKLYSIRCKAELWEEVLSKALIKANFGSDWKPDFNHKVGVDITTHDGILISCKSGTMPKNMSSIKFSGSRLTSHETLEKKLKFLSNKTEDYIFFLAATEKMFTGSPIYYFIVVDSDTLDYHNAEWVTRFNKSGKRTSDKGIGNGYTAVISKSMSEQIWTTIKDPVLHFKEMYKIEL